MEKNTPKTKSLVSAVLICGVVFVVLSGCGRNGSDSEPVALSDGPDITPITGNPEEFSADWGDIPPMSGNSANVSEAGPNLSAQVEKAKPADIPRFAVNSPFAGAYDNPVPKEAKRLWARSCLWDKAPEFVVEKWLTDEPAMKDKYLMVEFWGTWCSQCRRVVPLLNGFHEKYKDRLSVIGISDEEEQVIRKFAEGKIEFNLAMDRRKRMQNELAVRGFPHIIIVEPGGHVVWEGFPLLKGYKLTEAVVEKILAVGEKAESTD